jgi:predicted dehydrogenase
LRQLEAEGLLNVKAVCDVSEHQLTGVTGRWARYDSVHQLLKFSRPDLLVIATPPQSHALLVREAIRGCIDVLCEKPLALTHGDVAAIAELVAQQPSIALFTVLQYKYSPAWRFVLPTVRAAITKDEEFVIRVHVSRSEPDPLARTSWRRNTHSHHGGGIADHFIHYVSLARTITRQLSPISARRLRSEPETVEAAIRMGSGMMVGRISYGETDRTTALKFDCSGLRTMLLWQDQNLTLKTAGRPVRRWEVPSLSDRVHVDRLYIDLYMDVCRRLADAAGRRSATQESIDVACVVTALLQDLG